jgi:hypothetical protein
MTQTAPTLAPVVDIRPRRHLDAVPASPVERDEHTVAAIATDLYELLVDDLMVTVPGTAPRLAPGLAAALANITDDPAGRLLDLARFEAHRRLSGGTR